MKSAHGAASCASVPLAEPSCATDPAAGWFLPASFCLQLLGGDVAASPGCLCTQGAPALGCVSPGWQPAPHPWAAGRCRACWGSPVLLGFGCWEQNPELAAARAACSSPALPAHELWLLVRALPGAGQPGTTSSGGRGALRREPARRILAERSFFCSPLSLWLPHMAEEQKQSSGVTHPSGEGGIRATRDSKHGNSTRRELRGAARSVCRLLTLRVLPIRGL